LLAHFDDLLRHAIEEVVERLDRDEDMLGRQGDRDLVRRELEAVVAPAEIRRAEE
jgi:hypothetical protein